MVEKFDVIIIGSGLGGLVCANILSKEGFKVLILEKNNQFGGNLQTFARDKCIFDTGVHYIGGLAPGQNLYQYFNYLGIADQLQLKRMDMDAFDCVTFDDDAEEYPYAQGGENFIRQLSRYFPDDTAGIRQYYLKMKSVCDSFPLYQLHAGEASYQSNELLMGEKAKEVIDSFTENPKLRAILAGTNLLYAGAPEKTPFYVHALSVNSYIDSAWRCVNGGSQLAKLLLKEIRKHGGKALKYQEVTQFNLENGKLRSVATVNQKEFSATTFISNIDPKRTLALIGDYPIRKTYRSRILAFEDTISTFSLYIVLKPNTIPYVNKNYYHFKNERSVWNAISYQSQTWPEAYMVSMTPTSKDEHWAETMTVFTYMDYAEVAQWAGTFNTVAEKNERGQAYAAFKQEKTNVMLAALEKRFPGLSKQISSTYASTPLTYRDYIGSDTGSMYGFAKNANTPLKNYLPSRTKIENLLLTGQSVNMHGILGVTIGAVLTCAELIGKEKLLQKILTANQ